MPRADPIAVLPAFDCASTVGSVITRLRRHLARVVVVDDGSSDATAEEAGRAGACVVRLERNMGKGAALRRGAERALAEAPEALLLLDADGQHDPDDLPSLLAEWDRREVDLLVGCRLADGRAIPRARFWANYIGSRALSWMTGVELLDSQSGFRLIRAELWRRLRLAASGYAIESEMLLKACRRGARVGHAPIRTIYDGAESHYRPWRDTFLISCASIYFKVFDEP